MIPVVLKNNSPERNEMITMELLKHQDKFTSDSASKLLIQLLDSNTIKPFPSIIRSAEGLIDDNILQACMRVLERRHATNEYLASMEYFADHCMFDSLPRLTSR